ncbi:nuclear envelope integral membrane protein 2 [Lutra lutra]|uniref:nuclear envelope integral membrane protein 2 n=1 Tax=Lutra lutra TaxID=9657 RepID=UPI001FD629A0|nr:nuclear envelope integral membrane protein 2 [Lutra lutra]
MTLVFVLLLVKRFIPKYSTFWALMVGCCFASVYAVCGWMEDLKWLWHENRVYVLGYVLMVGFVSFAVCYKHGPLVNERSVNLLAWTLWLLSLVLIYCGVTVPQCSYAVMVLILSFRSLRYPLKAFSYVRWKTKRWRAAAKPAGRFLTDDEYREQADAETSRALEELRRACRRPDFPAWVVVSRLRAPNNVPTRVPLPVPGQTLTGRVGEGRAERSRAYGGPRYGRSFSKLNKRDSLPQRHLPYCFPFFIALSK